MEFRVLSSFKSWLVKKKAMEFHEAPRSEGPRSLASLIAESCKIMHKDFNVFFLACDLK